MLRSLGFGLGLETFVKFLMNSVSVSKNLVSVSVSENLVSEKKSRFRFQNFWSRKKSIGFGFGKIWYRKKVSVLVSENLVSEKKSWYRFRKIWYQKKSLGIGFS